MALTPQDVHSKQFSTVKMRTGYEMDEVDAFLDQIEMELSRLIAENDDLRAQLATCRSSLTDTEKKLADAKSAPPPSAPPAGTRAEAAPPPAAAAAALAAPVAEPAPVKAEPPAPKPEPAAPASDGVPERAFAMLEAAQKTADETVSSAKAEATKIVSAAKDEARRVTSGLEQQRTELEEQVNELRTFERNYRITLRETIATQLKEFDARGSVEPKAAPATVAAAQAAPKDDPTATAENPVVSVDGS
ncbi:MAG: DivIVA domain-containing protein [bacterium]